LVLSLDTRLLHWGRALIIGALGAFFVFYKDNIMKQTNLFGITMDLLITVVMESVEHVALEIFTTYLPYFLPILLVGVTDFLLVVSLPSLQIISL